MTIPFVNTCMGSLYSRFLYVGEELYSPPFIKHEPNACDDPWGLTIICTHHLEISKMYPCNETCTISAMHW